MARSQRKRQPHTKRTDDSSAEACGEAGKLPSANWKSVVEWRRSGRVMAGGRRLSSVVCLSVAGSLLHSLHIGPVRNSGPTLTLNQTLVLSSVHDSTLSPTLLALPCHTQHATTSRITIRSHTCYRYASNLYSTPLHSTPRSSRSQLPHHSCTLRPSNYCFSSTHFSAVCPPAWSFRPASTYAPVVYTVTAGSQPATSPLAP